MPTAVTVTELKATLSRQIARAKDGEQVIIIERGLPVARLEPIVGVDVKSLTPHQLELIRKGHIRLPRSAWSQADLERFHAEIERMEPLGSNVLVDALIAEREEDR